MVMLTPAALPTALHINLGAGTTTATPQFVPEACGTRGRDRVRLAVCGHLVLVQLVTGHPGGILNQSLPFQLPGGRNWFYSPLETTSLKNFFRNMTFKDCWNWKVASELLWSKPYLLQLRT